MHKLLSENTLFSRSSALIVLFFMSSGVMVSSDSLVDPLGDAESSGISYLQSLGRSAFSFVQSHFDDFTSGSEAQGAILPTSATVPVSSSEAVKPLALTVDPEKLELTPVRPELPGLITGDTLTFSPFDRVRRKEEPKGFNWGKWTGKNLVVSGYNGLRDKVSKPEVVALPGQSVSSNDRGIESGKIEKPVESPSSIDKPADRNDSRLVGTTPKTIAKQPSLAQRLGEWFMAQADGAELTVKSVPPVDAPVQQNVALQAAESIVAPVMPVVEEPVSRADTSVPVVPAQEEIAPQAAEAIAAPVTPVAEELVSRADTPAPVVAAQEEVASQAAELIAAPVTSVVEGQVSRAYTRAPVVAAQEEVAPQAAELIAAPVTLVVEGQVSRADTPAPVVAAQEEVALQAAEPIAQPSKPWWRRLGGALQGQASHAEVLLDLDKAAITVPGKVAPEAAEPVVALVMPVVEEPVSQVDTSSVALAKEGVAVQAAEPIAAPKTEENVSQADTPVVAEQAVLDIGEYYEIHYEGSGETLTPAVAVEEQAAVSQVALNVDQDAETDTQEIAASASTGAVVTANDNSMMSWLYISGGVVAASLVAYKAYNYLQNRMMTPQKLVASIIAGADASVLQKLYTRIVETAGVVVMAHRKPVLTTEQVRKIMPLIEELNSAQRRQIMIAVVLHKFEVNALDKKQLLNILKETL